MDSGMPDKDGLVPPYPSGATYRKKRYAPIQWWPLRLTNPWHKVAVLVGWWVVSGVLRWGFESIVTSPFETDVWLVVGTVAIVVFARSCRGTDEPIAPPRPWWRLTARPVAGWWLGVLFLIGIAAPFSHAWEPHQLLDGATSLFLGLAFLNSSVRLTFNRRRAE